MAIAYRSSGTFVAAAATSSGAIGLPAGLANGDTMVMPIQARGGGTVTTPSGYTRGAEVNITAGHRLVVFYKYVTNAAGEAAPSVTQSASGLICGRISAFSGCDATTQLDVTAVTGKHGDLATVTAPTATPVSIGTMAVWIFSSADDNTLNAATQGTTAYSSDTTTGADGSLALVYELQTNATAVGSCAMTESVNGPDNWNTVTLLLRPSAVAAGNPSRDLGFDSITYALEAAFGSSPFAPSPTWTDLSAYVRAADGITATRGRGSEFSDVQPGTMTLTLDNRDRLFDPDYTAGTYFGQLLPMVRIRLRVRKSSVNYPIFDGYIQSWEQGYHYPREATVTVNAVDLFGRLATRKLPPSLLSVAMIADTPNAYFPMFEEEGRVCADLSRNGWIASYGASVQFPDSFLPGETQFKAKRLETFSAITDFSMFNASDVTVENIRTFETWIQIGLIDTAIDVDDLSSSIIYLLASATSNLMSFDVYFVAAELGGIADVENLGITVAVGIADGSTGVGAGCFAPVAAGVPLHLVTTLDSTYTTNSLYVNGQLVDTQDVSAGTFTAGAWESSISSFVGGGAEVFISHTATYEDTLTAAQVLEHYEIGLSGGRGQTVPTRLDLLAEFAGLTAASLYDNGDLAANTYLGSANLTGTVLSAMQSVMVTEQGRLFTDAAGVLQAQGRTADMKDLTVNAVVQATLSDSGVYAYASPDGIHIQPGIVDLIRNTEYVSAAGATVTVSDSDSVALFDEREESIATELEDQTAASNLGLFRLLRFADPTTRIDQVTLLPHGTADVRYTLVFTVDLGWRLTVTRTPQAISTAISKTVTVEGVTHQITDANWITTLYLVPAVAAYTVQPWWTIGDATYGQIETSNQIPY